MDEAKALERIDDSEGIVERPVVRPEFLMRLSSRIGVWGLLGGMAGVLSPILGISVPFRVSMTLGGIGLLAGGLGIAAASSLVLRETWGTKRVLKYAAMAGIPFGFLAAAHGAVVLWFMPWVMEHMQLGDWMTMGAFGLGVILMVLLVAGFVNHVRQMPDSEAEFI